MINMASLSAINVNVNSEIKKEATDIFNDMGISMSTAINMFLSQVVRTKSIPFELLSLKPSRKLRKALKEADDIISGKKKTKVYHNVDEMFKDILNEDWNTK